jgi:GNAT superfamily N-acetyltransferase
MSQREAFENGKEHFTYQFHQAPTYAGTHEVTAHDTKGKKVGSLTWNANEIENIDVAKKHQGKGIAESMLVHARRQANDEKAPVPSHSLTRTRAGHAFAKKTGGAGSAIPDKYITFLD